MTRHYRYTHKRFDTYEQPIAWDTGVISADTAEAVKDRLTERFGLQDWNGWTCTANGTHQRTHTPTPKRPYRGVLILEPIQLE